MRKPLTNTTALLILGLFTVLSFTDCNFSKGVKKDLNTGLSASYNGASLEDIYLADGNEKRLGSNKVSLGSPVVILATGVDDFKVENGKIFPGCQIILTDKSNTELLNLPDAFSNMEGGMPEAEAKVLKGIVNTGSPMVVGQTYHIKVRFFDKKQPGSEIVADADIQMTE
jgi:hypothetical protein